MRLLIVSIARKIVKSYVGVNETGMAGEKIGKGFLSSHIFTGNAFTSWRWQDTGKFSAIVTYFDSGIPHPTGYRSSAYFMALEYGRRGYIGSPNKFATDGYSGNYTYPHYKVGPAGGAFIVTNTHATLEVSFPIIMSEAVSRAL